MVGIFPHDNLFYLSSTLVESPSNNLLLPFKYPCRSLLTIFFYLSSTLLNPLLTIFFYLSSTLVESPSNNLLLPFEYLVESLLTIFFYLSSTLLNPLLTIFFYLSSTLLNPLLTIFFYLSSTPLNCCYPSTSFCLMLIIISFVKDDKCGLSHPLFLLTLQN